VTEVINPNKLKTSFKLCTCYQIRRPFKHPGTHRAKFTQE